MEKLIFPKPDFAVFFLWAPCINVKIFSPILWVRGCRKSPGLRVAAAKSRPQQSQALACHVTRPRRVAAVWWDLTEKTGERNSGR